MEGMKLIDASEVTTSKRTSKVEIKKVKKSPMKIITDEDKKSTTEDTSENDVVQKPFTLKPDIAAGPNVIVKPDIVKTVDVVPETNVNRTIMAIKLNESIYYGPKNVNKNKFMRLYKKLGLVWTTGVSLNGMLVDGWFNEDKSQYIIKLLEDGDFKRFKFYGCDDIYDYFVRLGAVVFDYNKENSLSSNYLNNKVNDEANNKVSNNVNNDESVKENPVGVANKNGAFSTIGDTDKDDKFIGADLWSRRRTKQLLKNMPDNWGVMWK